MNWNTAEFESAFAKAGQLAPCTLPEVCFSGRSNVGKSSLINRLLCRKQIARVSSTPGKTVTVNFYKLSGFRIVDLPGYGYAKVAAGERERWAELMETYFGSGRDIRLCLQLVDMRHPATPDDMQMIKFLTHYKIPFAIITTKSDKLKKSQAAECLAALRDQLGAFAANAPIIPFSALNGSGSDEIRQVIEKALL